MVRETVRRNPWSSWVLFLALAGSICGVTAFLTGKACLLYAYGVVLSLKWAVAASVVVAFASDRNKKMAVAAGVAYGVFYLSKFLVAAALVPPPAQATLGVGKAEKTEAAAVHGKPVPGR